jgi:hypothetical protein
MEQQFGKEVKKYVYFIIICLGFISCWRDEKSARADCFKNNVGEYKIDLKRTSEGNQGLGPYKRLSGNLELNVL